MDKRMALLFAIIGTVLLGLVGVALSFRSLAWTGATVLAAIGFIGSGFVVKARMRKARILHERTAGTASPAYGKDTEPQNRKPAE
ncbi:DUF5325 family protein [Ferviditalea candida]|uniref:DUF5325 family protein n=1 Tax=Ferviditalea candida TaxID=3108399 RepID=A0ABU5ZCU5_9BACL|nr:DUF5325 family protein [Paenibacillaceae bacterium T2]